MLKYPVLFVLSLASIELSLGFTNPHIIHSTMPGVFQPQFANRKNRNEMTSGDNKGEVVELVEDEIESGEKAVTATGGAAPTFLSQGEIDKENLNVDLANPKQTRVILYIIVSLLPVLFLIPFMLSRDLIPLDELPPVTM